jgi:hypothetical protein
MLILTVKISSVPGIDSIWQSSRRSSEEEHES